MCLRHLLGGDLCLTFCVSGGVWNCHNNSTLASLDTILLFIFWHHGWVAIVHERACYCERGCSMSMDELQDKRWTDKNGWINTWSTWRQQHLAMTMAFRKNDSIYHYSRSDQFLGLTVYQSIACHRLDWIVGVVESRDLKWGNGTSWPY